MLTVPVAAFIFVMQLAFADEREANIAAHEFCPDNHVVRVDDRYEIGCEGREYTVLCDDGSCVVGAAERAGQPDPVAVASNKNQ